MPSPGDVAPDFEAPTQSGTTLKLSSLRGSTVVLYFYPEADTPGCTMESQGFRDHYAAFRAKGVHVVGVSTDGVDAQCAFADKYGLPFPLVADSSKEVARLYGVLGPGGRARRVTFLIDPQGKVARVIEVKKATDHVTEARKALLAG